jgi:hypothetical protein
VARYPVRNLVFWVLLSLFIAIPVLAQGPFSSTVYPILEKASCRSCHHADGVASATRLHFPEPGVPQAQIEAFGHSLVSLVNRDAPEKSLLLNKPTNRAAHTGGLRIAPGSAEEAALKAWVETLAKLHGAELQRALHYRPASEGASIPPAPVLRRLTHSQYNNVARDLLGELGQPANQFPPEDFVNGYKNQYQSQSLSPMLFEAYSAAAEKLARNVVRRGDIDQLTPCKPSPGCAAEFVRGFGRKAFRRPLNPAEQNRYEALLAASADFTSGRQAVVEAMLQSPHFLFHLDAAGDPALKPYAAASRLSFALWNTMPDETLLADAARGELKSPEGLSRTVRRMLDNPKAAEALDEFVSQWLRFDRALATGRDRRLYPKFSRETAVAMTEEARRFVGDLVWQNRNFMDLFTATDGYVNRDLAELYGVPAPSADFGRVAFPPASERAGLLGQALFLTLTANTSDSSPTSRGLFVREQFLCQHIADPPPGVSTNLPPVSQAKPQTNRQRLGVHAADKTCAGCHDLVDPIGFGLEKFDAIGARREKAKLVFYPLDRKSKEPPKTVEIDLDTSGWLAGVADSKFSSPKELGAILARTPECQECVVKQYFRYVAGRPETPADRPLLRTVTQQFRETGFRFQDMIVSLLTAREFGKLP